MKMYRQGDVLVVEVDRLPEDASEVSPDAFDRVVLAYGELTGHAHAIPAQCATAYRHGDDTFLACRGGAVLRHEEHSPIPLPDGIYRVVRQREYAPDFLRQVID